MAKVGDSVNKIFAVKKCNIGVTKNGSKYLDLTLSTSKGDINAKQWDFQGEPPEENTAIVVEGVLDQYKGKPQIIINSWGVTEDYDPKEFIPCHEDLDGLKEDFLDFIENYISNEEIKGFVLGAYKEHEYIFTHSPASVKHHHAYIGGLMEHSLNVARYSLNLASEDTNKDVLLASALLHDIGKIHCYDFSGCTIKMTTACKLFGHIILGILDLKDVAKQHEEILHCIASHHGKLEFGSPVEPCTKEALILHYADMIDSQLWKVRDAEANSEGEWTERVYGIGREFYRGV